MQIDYYSHLNLFYRFNVAESYGMLILSLFHPVEFGTSPNEIVIVLYSERVVFVKSYRLFFLSIKVIM